MATVEIPGMFLGSLAGYCDNQDCMAREVTVRLKHLDATVGEVRCIHPVCPVCHLPMKADWEGWLTARSTEQSQVERVGEILPRVLGQMFPHDRL